jgi:hypothetical protein
LTSCTSFTSLTYLTYSRPRHPLGGRLFTSFTPKMELHMMRMSGSLAAAREQMAASAKLRSLVGVIRTPVSPGAGSSLTSPETTAPLSVASASGLGAELWSVSAALWECGSAARSPRGLLSTGSPPRSLHAPTSWRPSLSSQEAVSRRLAPGRALLLRRWRVSRVERVETMQVIGCPWESLDLGRCAIDDRGPSRG